MRSLTLAIIAFAALSACGDAANDSEPPTLDTSLQAIADEAGLEIVDISVPFERLAQAPKQLQAVSRASHEGPPAVYVMRYSDDTLRQTFHAFVIGDTEQTYVKLTTSPGKGVTQAQFDIHDASYDEASESLVLDTHAGLVRIRPQDVTPVGA